MADIKTLRTQEELDLINQVYGDAFMETRSFELAREAYCLAAQRNENVKALKAFTDFCETNGVSWFVYSSTLRGAVSYKDFLPGSFLIDLGMFRTDYQRFEAAYNALSESDRDALSWLYQPYFEGTTIRRIFAHVDNRTGAKVRKPNGEIVYGSDQLPRTVKGGLQVAVFDEVPDDFFTRKKFYRQMSRRNTVFKKAALAKGVPDAEELGYTMALKPGQAAFGLVPLRAASWGMHSLAKRYQGRDMQNIARMTGWRSVTVPKTDIGETQWMDFHGMPVRCPVRPDIWAKEPVFETTPELKRLQDDAKQIVSEIDRICTELGIRYFACGGTMLGHVRHGGFIPWDDDIDVGMLREDYEIFKKRAGELIDADRFFLQTRQTDPSIPYLFSKVRMNDTEYITEYNKFRPFHKGICVDVFPFDYIPNGTADQSAFKSEVLAAAKAHNRVVNRQYTRDQAKENKPDRKDLDYWVAQFIGRTLAHHYHNVSLKETQAAYDLAATRYDANHDKMGLKFVASFVPGYTMAQVTDLFPTQRVQFEDIEVEIPRKPEIFLSMQYGDYMVMPYPHQRAGHDLLLWSDEEGVGGGREAEGMMGDN